MKKAQETYMYSLFSVTDDFIITNLYHILSIYFYFDILPLKSHNNPVYMSSWFLYALSD
ncbi:hypothetical protein GLOIN_2v1603506 [Rhizophagus irregularis DAOM 181602=DAOM 197198]|uniref:Uncharacterized protein n=1 Tax=Rhizophagus irregularis (strain DAOM 181602 / DAOM 197198 / MUCL 43194) TaxID=747089 RepID=A0A2P4Q296_RHIID|nr:hypothetical protein GLOIN_2v1603506 [Rhizophagus irregularis DAOM 181602=DAOM 197198]POG71712.1 hypothetical protein GLOIN_2v1603506 [Rhizophagus irregularis DAOM 181602=DAOM 197198]|eukprot:XP_025178578.1 hypothetical protein GLOIN_2v1603506 [Rhizophagus irregularis DAOM 181602=DAOM 197198]